MAGPNVIGDAMRKRARERGQEIGEVVDPTSEAAPKAPRRTKRKGGSPEEALPGAVVREVPIDQLEPDPAQPRRGIAESAAAAAELLKQAEGDIGRAIEAATDHRVKNSVGSLLEAAATIRAYGIQLPIRARVRMRSKGARWIIESGERRWHAARLAGVATVPILEVPEDSEAERLARQLIENAAREDLPAADRALATWRLFGQLGSDRDALRAKLGLADSITSRLLIAGEWLAGGGEPPSPKAGINALYNAALRAKEPERPEPRRRIPKAVKRALEQLEPTELLKRLLATAPPRLLRKLVPEAEAGEE